MEKKQHQSLNEAIKRVVLGEATKDKQGYVTFEFKSLVDSSKFEKELRILKRKFSKMFNTKLSGKEVTILYDKRFSTKDEEFSTKDVDMVRTLQQKHNGKLLDWSGKDPFDVDTRLLKKSASDLRKESIKRVVLGEAKVKGKPIKLSPQEIKQYTLKLDNKIVNTSDKSGDDMDSMDEYVTYDFDILYKGKKIGSGDYEDYFGEMWFEIDGKNSPKLDGTKGRGSSTIKMLEDSFRLFLKWKTFPKWAKNVSHFQRTYNKGN